MGHVRRSLKGVLALLFMATSALLIGHPASMPAAVGIRSVAGGGDKLWLDRYDGGGLEDAFDVAASPDGSTVFVTGESDYEYVTFAYDSITGSTLWARRYSGPGSTYNLALDIEVTPDGSKVFVTGYSSTPTTGDDYATVAYDARTGTPLWASRFDGPDHAQDLPEGLAVSPDGSKVFVTGWSEGGHSNDYATIAYDAVSGARLWLRRYDGTGHASDRAWALAVSGNAVFVTGQSMGPGHDYDYATVAYDQSTGSPLWVSRYNGPANAMDWAYAAGVSPDGSRVFVTGHSGGSGTEFDFATFAYDTATGAIVWGQRYAGPGGNDEACCLAVTPDGSKVLVAGWSESSTTREDFATLAYDAATGAKLWKSRFNGRLDGSDTPTDIAVTSQKVFVTGVVSRLAEDYLTVAYDAASGGTLWVASFAGPGHYLDRAKGIALSPDASRVFVTGYSQSGTGADDDYVTVAYEA